jgi:hypothetical protein
MESVHADQQNVLDAISVIDPGVSLCSQPSREYQRADGNAGTHFSTKQLGFRH